MKMMKNGNRENGDRMLPRKEVGGIFGRLQNELDVGGRDLLFDLYVARVAKAETVQTVRRDARAIFRDAFVEARCALDVYLECAKNEGVK